jgi:hypothetical protein
MSEEGPYQGNSMTGLTMIIQSAGCVVISIDISYFPCKKDIFFKKGQTGKKQNTVIMTKVYLPKKK